VGKGGLVVVSVFVNPTQFGPNEDFDAYPRDLARDVALCGSAGVDVVFAPLLHGIYFGDASTDVLERSLSQLLCGASRPGHFAGVCLVVLKLLNIVQPRQAVFGKKDYQQLAIVRRMVRDLNVEVEIVGIDTVRESDGLAMSSRNVYLSAEERPQAAAIRRALLNAAASLAAGEHQADVLSGNARAIIEQDAPLGRIDYLEVVDAESMQRVSTVLRPSVMAVAVFFGQCRLIDNVELLPTATGIPEDGSSS
ncbi:MAG: pantoate--beta-alanine ligase, partial [Verrucomicrobia bacterium]|nr:pantoate--beta-alanine ligase [Verrucomicrobiota bacterium]